MNAMFFGAATFDQDLPDWNVHKVKNMANMFTATPAFRGNLAGWNTSSCEVMSDMFSGSLEFNSGMYNSFTVYYS